MILYNDNTTSVYKLINFYSKHFPFPHRGRKYVESWMRRTGLNKRLYTKKLSNGMLIEVRPEDHIDQLIFWYGSYQSDVGRAIEKICTSTSVVLDIGANIGYFTLLAANKATNGEIYCFEPSARTFRRLVANVQLNNLRNVHCFHNAVTASAGTAELYLSSGENTGMSSFRVPENFSGEIETVQTISIDEFIFQHRIESIDLIKIDIEGSEMEALRGMHDCLTRFQPALIIELNPSTLALFDHKPGDIIKHLERYGYTPHSIPDMLPFNGNIVNEMNLLFLKDQVTRS